MSYVFILSVGPVQGFIAQARKTQDLYSGSRLLSELCRAAIDEAENKDIEIVFPYLPKGTQFSSIPNRMVGIYRGLNDLSEIGSAIEQAVKDKWQEKIDKVLKEQSKHEPRIIDFGIQCQVQLDNLLEIYWIFEPMKNDDYATAYALAEKHLGGVKNFRPFQQTEEKGRKCTLDGERNVKFYRTTDNEKSDYALSNKLFCKKEEVCISSRLPLSILQLGEGLSAVSFIKRGSGGQSFPSTAEIALMDSLHKIKIGDNSKTLDKVFQYRAKVGEGFDEQLYYPENINDDYLRKNGFYKEDKVTAAILQPLYDTFKKDLTLQKYYALVMFDGDHMGKVVGGAYLKDKNKLASFQKKCSELLFNYADWAQNELKSPKGRTVYTGGDDFLGFVNINYLFEVLNALRDTFESDVNMKLKEEFENDLVLEGSDAFNFTFSAGVVLAHYKTPLSIVLKKAREMEHRAKEKGGRDALAVAVMKHSGETHEGILKWTQLTYLKFIQEQLLSNFSASFIDHLQRAFYPLVADKKDTFLVNFNDDGGARIVESEIKRLVKRSKKTREATALQSQLADNVIALFKDENIQHFNTFDNFSQVLNLAEFTRKKISLSQ
jgi:CRISPR-associated protein Cmr2